MKRIICCMVIIIAVFLTSCSKGILGYIKAKAEEGSKRSELVLATMDDGNNLVAMAAEFKRNDSQYHITVKKYGWNSTTHALTQDEINAILDLISDATPFFSVKDDVIIGIINEEAGAYYSGQKSVDDVAGIIQNRIQVYVSENS